MNSPSATSPRRLASIDTYRGFVMLLMMAEVLELMRVSKALPPDNSWHSLWAFLAYHQTHADWTGCSLHDLIQPSFTFLVGVALPFSLARRTTQSATVNSLAAPRQTTSSRVLPTTAILHATRRALLLIALGILLRSIGQPQTRFTFEDTLTQIGLGYLPLFLLALAPQRWWYVSLVLLLVGYWLAFVLYPLPPNNFDYARVGVPADWSYHSTGLAAHFNKNSNVAWAFDVWFLNLFPRAEAFVFHRGGYATLSFIPTLATMVLGLIAGDWLRRTQPTFEPTGLRISPATAIRRLVIAGIVSMLAGLVLHYAGLCPIVKRIWTPSWTLFSGGWCFLIMAGWYTLIDVWRKKTLTDQPQRTIGQGMASYGSDDPPRWTFPLRVIGMNSIAAYMIAHLFEKFLIGSFATHLGPNVLRNWGEAYEPFVVGVLVLTTYWLILYWMYRRQVFLKI